MKAIGYARVSTTKQDLARQQVKIKDFCENNGHDLLQIIEDFGISGASNQRDGYKKLLSLTDKDCNVVIVSELSRLSRQEYVIETVYNIQNIINSGISVILLD
ncbi:MAG: recombinase family protein, partial [Bacteroidales bacterium]